MDWKLLIILGLVIIFILEIASKFTKKKKSNERINRNINSESEGAEEPEKIIDNIEYKFYRKKYLFTKNEYYFYKQLREIAETKNLIPLTKIRLADFIEVTNKKEYMKYFAKIRSKHIDFLLLNKDTLNIVLAIELDDGSHNDNKDEFKNKLFEQIKIPLIRCKGIGTIEEQIIKVLENNNF